MREGREYGFRYGREGDERKIKDFIGELAEFHGKSGAEVTEEELRESIFKDNRAEVIFILDGEREAGFALFFRNYSSVLGKSGIHLEDLYVKEEYRGLGYGRALLRRLARIAKERGCCRVEWMCHAENGSSLCFYRGLGARELEEWRLFRLEGEALDSLAYENGEKN